MMRIIYLAPVVAALAAPLAEGPNGFAPLFSGHDLSGWKVFDGKANAWGVDAGILFVKGEGGGWLMTEKEYADFEVCLEYKMTPQGNSGVALRAPLRGNPAYQGMEIQLLDDANYRGLRPAQYAGSIYDVVAPSRHVTRPHGRWNKIRIRARGPHIEVELNDISIVDADLTKYQDRAREHPGLRRRQGHLGLQSHTNRVEFRNLYVKPLGPPAER
jgi:hypothetical protein